MADLIIRGMKMPKHCIDCPLMICRYDSDACALQSEEANAAMENWDDMRRGCPLVPLPDGHGRLIDADALCRFVANNNRIDGIIAAGIIAYINAAHTIVPAEGGGE